MDPLFVEACQHPIVTVVLAFLNVYQVVKLRQIETRGQRVRRTDAEELKDYRDNG